MTHFSAISHLRFTAGQGRQTRTRIVYLIAKVTHMAFKTGGRKCKFESLETRQMMAGDVVGKTQPGTLTLKGDNFTNGITIIAGAVPHSILVTGFTPTGSTGTTVNGVASGTGVTFLNVTKGVKIEMKAGNDVVEFQNVTIDGKVKIDMGSGDDVVRTDFTNFNSSLEMNTKGGTDLVDIDNDTTVNGKTTIKTGADFDNVSIDDSRLGELKIRLEGGDDELAIEHTIVVRQSSLDGGKGLNAFDEGISNYYGGIFNKKKLAGGLSSV